MNKLKRNLASILLAMGITSVSGTITGLMLGKLASDNYIHGELDNIQEKLGELNSMADEMHYDFQLEGYESDDLAYECTEPDQTILR